MKGLENIRDRHSRGLTERNVTFVHAFSESRHGLHTLVASFPRSYHNSNRISIAGVLIFPLFFQKLRPARLCTQCGNRTKQRGNANAAGPPAVNT